MLFAQAKKEPIISFHKMVREFIVDHVADLERSQELRSCTFSIV